jgi:hypothetical protein
MTAARLLRVAFGLVRAAAAVLVLLAIVVVGSARAAERHVGDRLAAFGDALVGVEGIRVHSAKRRLGLNGMELGVVTFSTELDVASTLDRLESVCQRGGLEEPETLLGRQLESAPARAFSRLTRGIFRQETPERGVIGCVDTDQPLQVTTLAERLSAVARTGDLGELGALRFVFVRRTKSTTTALVLWSAGSLPFLHAFPKTGDAPGHDLDGVARPSGSRRLLSAAEHGAPYQLVMYEVPVAAGSDPLAVYARELERAGFTVARLARKDTLLLRKGSQALLVCLSQAEGRRTLSIARLS